jgi:hypothetical protein
MGRVEVPSRDIEGGIDHVHIWADDQTHGGSSTLTYNR